MAERRTPALGESPTELMQARATLEGAVVALAAARVTRAGLDRVADSLAAMKREHARGRMPVEADRRFHLGIAELAGNTVLVRMVGELFDGRHSPISSRMSGHAETVQTWTVALAEHERIYRALEARDPQAAAAAMFTHLRASEERWVSEPSTSVEPVPATGQRSGRCTPHWHPLCATARPVCSSQARRTSSRTPCSSTYGGWPTSTAPVARAYPRGCSTSRGRTR